MRIQPCTRRLELHDIMPWTVILSACIASFALLSWNVKKHFCDNIFQNRKVTSNFAPSYSFSSAENKTKRYDSAEIFLQMIKGLVAPSPPHIVGVWGPWDYTHCYKQILPRQPHIVPVIWAIQYLVLILFNCLYLGSICRRVSIWTDG